MNNKHAGRLIIRWIGILFLVYLMTSYFVLPRILQHYAHHPELKTFPKTSYTKEGLAGDPLNVGLVGDMEEIVKAMTLAGWDQADALKLKSDLKMGESVVLKRSYDTAPVSRFYLFGRMQDVSFEKQVGSSPKERHHVRFWKTDITSIDGRFLWVGSVTFDQGVGISHRTGQITHHIAPDVDKERDFLMAELIGSNQITQMYQVSGIGPTINGRNGGGDRYFSDGELTIGVLSPQNKAVNKKPSLEANPLAIELKNNLWQIVRPILK